LGVAGGFDAAPDAGFALGVVAVIVVLVDGEDDGGGVHHGLAGGEDFPDEPVVPVGTADGEGREVRAIEAAGEGEVVDPIGGPGLTGASGEVAEFGLPGGALEGPGAMNIDVGALANHEEFLVGGGDGAEGAGEIVEEENVAIDVANGVVAGELLGLEEDGVEEDGAELVAVHVGLVAEVEFAGDLGGAFVGAEEDDLDLGMEAHPGLNGVALDDVDVPFKGLGDGEEGEHVLRIAKDRRNVGKDRLNVGKIVRTSQRRNV